MGGVVRIGVLHQEPIEIDAAVLEATVPRPQLPEVSVLGLSEGDFAKARERVADIGLEATEVEGWTPHTPRPQHEMGEPALKEIRKSSVPHGCLDKLKGQRIMLRARFARSTMARHLRQGSNARAFV